VYLLVFTFGMVSGAEREEGTWKEMKSKYRSLSTQSKIKWNEAWLLK